MNLSTEGVLIPAAVVLDLLKQFEPACLEAKPLFEMAHGVVNAHQPSAMVRIELFNTMCAWVEKTHGIANIREAGRRMGLRTYDLLVWSGKLGLRPTPNRLFEELRRHELLATCDPLRRGWEILESRDQRMRLRFTQTSNCMLMEGLLQSLLERSGAVMPRVNHTHCARNDAAYCEFETLWLKAQARPSSRNASGWPLKV